MYMFYTCPGHCPLIRSGTSVNNWDLNWLIHRCNDCNIRIVIRKAIEQTAGEPNPAQRAWVCVTNVVRSTPQRLSQMVYARACTLDRVFYFILRAIKE